MKPISSLLLTMLLALAACSTPTHPLSGTQHAEHIAFRNNVTWTQSAYVDEDALATTPKGDVDMTIDLETQRALVFDRQNRVLMDIPVATGKPGHSTPTGSFTILNKKEMHRSNLYGVVEDAGGNVINNDADSRKVTIPEGGRFVGASMPYWQRLTNSGVGLHVGYVPMGRVASHGCIRFPSNVMPKLFAKTVVGTNVDIVDGFEFTHYPQGAFEMTAEELEWFNNSLEETREMGTELGEIEASGRPDSQDASSGVQTFDLPPAPPRR